MKKSIIIVCAFVLILCGFVSKSNFLTSIYGTIDPPEMAGKVLAISDKDSVAVEPADGKFSLALPHAGKWKLVVLAIKPYKDAVVENISVAEGKSTDAGTIRLVSE